MKKSQFWGCMFLALLVLIIFLWAKNVFPQEPEKTYTFSGTVRGIIIEWPYATWKDDPDYGRLTFKLYQCKKGSEYIYMTNDTIYSMSRETLADTNLFSLTATDLAQNEGLKSPWVRAIMLPVEIEGRSSYLADVPELMRWRNNQIGMQDMTGDGLRYLAIRDGEYGWRETWLEKDLILKGTYNISVLCIASYQLLGSSFTISINGEQRIIQATGAWAVHKLSWNVNPSKELSTVRLAVKGMNVSIQSLKMEKLNALDTTAPLILRLPLNIYEQK